MQNLKEIIENLGGDPYQILETDPDSELQILRKNYRNLATKYHPDKNKSEDAKMIFIKINQAYQFLQLQSNRALYASHIKAISEQQKRMEGMNAQRRKYAEDLKRREQQFRQQSEDMERELKRRKQYFRKKMEQTEEREKIKDEIVNNMGSEKFYQLVCSCDVKWEEGLAFTQQMLKIAFSCYGTIKNVQLQQKRNRAILTLSSIEDCSGLVEKFRHPLINVNFHLDKIKRDRLLKALQTRKHEQIDLSLNSSNIARIKQIINRSSTLYHKQAIL